MTVYLITGGAGSLGKELVKEILLNEPGSKIRILDINEHSMSLLENNHRLRKLYGDITDIRRTEKACKDVDVVIHCAAMKNLEITEYNTSELIRVNVLGTDNVINSSIDNHVKKLIFISSDKAVEPMSVYGASKLIGEHITLNHNLTNKYTRMSVFRSGNFTSSNGNVFEVWKNQVEKREPLTITEFMCTRYFIDINIAAKTILKLTKTMNGGETFVPNSSIMQEKSISCMASETLGFNLSEYKHGIKITGLRKGEKVNELIMHPYEVTKSYEDTENNCWVIR